MRNVSDKSCRENPNSHFMRSNFFVYNHAVYVVIWNNIVELDRSHDIMVRMQCILDN
jgi:hypothetical protein